jgi:hypothetical protein
MALLFRPLYEHWLLEATQAPLPAWKRRLLKQALSRDTALRCLAAELAEFSNETHAPAADKAPDLRARVVARALEPERQRPLFPSAWVPAGGIAVLLLLALVAVFQRPPAQPQAVQSADNLNTVAFPTPGIMGNPVGTPVGLPVGVPMGGVPSASTSAPAAANPLSATATMNSPAPAGPTATPGAAAPVSAVVAPVSAVVAPVSAVVAPVSAVVAPASAVAAPASAVDASPSPVSTRVTTPEATPASTADTQPSPVP